MNVSATFVGDAVAMNMLGEYHRAFCSKGHLGLVMLVMVPPG